MHVVFIVVSYARVKLYLFVLERRKKNEISRGGRGRENKNDADDDEQWHRRKQRTTTAVFFLLVVEKKRRKQKRHQGEKRCSENHRVLSHRGRNGQTKPPAGARVHGRIQKRCRPNDESFNRLAHDKVLGRVPRGVSVSYTHLTLPTILLV